jgi:hypothetical protein
MEEHYPARQLKVSSFLSYHNAGITGTCNKEHPYTASSSGQNRRDVL